MKFSGKIALGMVSLFMGASSVLSAGAAGLADQNEGKAKIFNEIKPACGFDGGIKLPESISFTLLYDAVKRGDVEKLKGMLEKGFSANEISTLERYPILHYAALSGNVEVVKVLVEHGAKANSGMYGAGRSGNILVVKYLAENGADINEGLYDISESGNVAAVKYLIEEKGADINWTDMFGHTVLHQAGKSGSIDTVKYLLEKGAKIDARDNLGRTVLYYAAVYSRNIDLLKFLVNKGADIKVKDNYNNTLLRLVRSSYNLVKMCEPPAFSESSRNHLDQLQSVIDYLRSKGVKE